MCGDVVRRVKSFRELKENGKAYTGKLEVRRVDSNVF